jgi:hypothetical protein
MIRKFLLPYSDIGPKSKTGTVPLIVALRSEEGVLQEARIAIGVQVPKTPTGTSTDKKRSGKGDGSLQDEIKAVQNPSTPDQTKNKVSFSWKTLAATGLGAVMKYFVPFL